ncbi:MAG: PilN domain-containing protein [Armatimonadota bacterium]
MANINLISARRAERVRVAKVAKGLLIGLIVVSSLGLGSAAFMTGQIFIAGGRVTAAEKELEKLRPILDEIEAAEKERLALQPKLTTLTEAQQATNRWYGILEGLKRAVPEETWLTNLAVEKSGDGPQTLRINGMTASQTRVGETMYRLTQQPEHYAKVDLRYSETSRAQIADAVEFELAAQLFQPEKSKTGAKDEAKTK